MPVRLIDNDFTAFSGSANPTGSHFRLDGSHNLGISPCKFFWYFTLSKLSRFRLFFFFKWRIGLYPDVPMEMITGISMVEKIPSPQERLEGYKVKS